MASAGLERTLGALLLGSGDPVLTPHQTMVSARAFDSQLTPQSKHNLHTKSTCSVWTPSLLEVLCSAEPLRAIPRLGVSQGELCSKMPPQTSGKKQKTSQRHLGSRKGAFGREPLPSQSARVDTCPVVFPELPHSLRSVAGLSLH